MWGQGESLTQTKSLYNTREWRSQNVYNKEQGLNEKDLIRS